MKKQKLSQGLKPRHVQLIALGGTIGTGLFLGVGQSIKETGPSILVAYSIAGLACFFLMRALGELLMSNPSYASYTDFITKYLGEQTGFVTVWTYWFCWITIAMAEITASGLYIQYWFPNFPRWLTGLIVLAILFLLNSTNVSAFGETEFWFALIKIVAILLLIITGILMVLLRYKTNAGFASITNLYKYGFFSNGIKGFISSFQMVIFSFVGIEIIGMTAAETKSPRKEIPKCIDNVPIRILLFYIGSLLALMCIYPWTKISTTSSPFVQVFSNAGIPIAASIINFVVLTAALSSCNSAIYSTGRLIYSASSSKSRFARLSKKHVPINSIMLSTLIIAIATILNLLFPKGIFTFISSVSTVCFLFIWSMIMLTHLKYRKVTHKKVSFRIPLYPYSDYFVLIFFIFIVIILFLKTTTLIALLGAMFWIIILSLVKIILDKKIIHNK